MSDEICPFCDVRLLVPVAENDLAFARRDTAPVRPLHTLIIPKRHIANVFEATHEELRAMHELALEVRSLILLEDDSVRGFNFGSNIGAVAGQTIFHAHVHLIPRRAGEAPLTAARSHEP
jgi:diadenosine tetraphosphate (Ap4A) HIT family hydrolase